MKTSGIGSPHPQLSPIFEVLKLKLDSAEKQLAWFRRDKFGAYACANRISENNLIW